MQFSDISQDLIDKILVSLTDFKSLAATILTSKHVYDVFQACPKSIVAAVACNVVGHVDVLPAAVRLVRASEPPPPEDDMTCMSLTRTVTQAELLVNHALVVQELRTVWMRDSRRRAA